MYRLTIVSGPNRGSNFNLGDGENIIGREDTNSIVLSSGSVSKQHCSISLMDDSVLLRDLNSTNGTFVNGFLVKQKELKSGDKISVGDFVLQYTGKNKDKVVFSSNFASNGNAALDLNLNEPVIPVSTKVKIQEPEDPIGKLKVQLEVGVMPFFYGWLLKTEYKTVISVIIIALTLSAAMASLVPTLGLVTESVNSEALLRAKLLARSISDRYGTYIATQQEARIDLSHYEREATVRTVAITTPDLAIVAPQARINQMLAGGAEAPFLVQYAKAVKISGLDKGHGKILDGGIAVYIDPIVVTDKRSGRPKVAAFTVVSIDYSSNEFATSDHSVFYAVAALIGLLIAVFTIFLIYRLSLKPFEVLSDELDQVLRGELPRVTHEFQFPELKSLWDSVNTLAQKAGVGGNSNTAVESEDYSWDSEASAFMSMADTRQEGFCAFDSEMNLVAVNGMFEDISGIRSTSIGSPLSQVARDRAFISLVEDIYSRISGMSYGAIEDDFEFSGNLLSLNALPFGPKNKRGVLLFFRRKDSE